MTSDPFISQAGSQLRGGLFAHVMLPTKKGRELTGRALLLSQLMAELGFEQSDGRKIFGQTSKMTEIEIRDIWQRSRSWKKAPKALFWTLVKRKNIEIREQLQGYK